MADTPALGAGGRKAVRVRIPLPAPIVQAVLQKIRKRDLFLKGDGDPGEWNRALRTLV